MRKRICIVPAGYKPLPPSKGGAVETLVQNLIEINEREKQFEFVILSVEDQEAKLTAKNYLHTEYVYFCGNERIDRIYFWCIYKVLKKFFHVVMPDYLLKHRMVEYVQKNQGTFDWIIFEAGEIDCLKFYSRMLDASKIIMHSHGEIRNKQKLENSLCYYLAVSDFVRKVWNDTVTCSEKRSKTLLNGINQAKFKNRLDNAARRNIRTKFGFTDDDIVLIYVGRIVPEKGVKELLRAMGYLPEEYKLLLVGSANFGQTSNTKYERDIKNKIRNLGKRVKFSGYIPNDEIAVYYQIGDISVVPSLFNDPAPLVIMEAMASGLPIITTGSGGIKEYCDESCATFVNRGSDFEFRLAKSIESLGKDKVKREQMSLAAIEKAKQYTDLAQYNNLNTILEEIGRTDI